MWLYKKITSFKPYIRLAENKARRKAENTAHYLSDGDKILDVGCGNLYIARELLRLNNNLHITGVDVMLLPEISTITEGNQIQFVQASAEQLPFPDDTFDTSLCFVTLHHIHNQGTVLRELSRVTKKSGFVLILEDGYTSRLGRLAIILNDIFHNFFKPEPSFDFGFRSFNEWIELFDSCDLKLIDYQKQKVHFNIMTQYLFILSPK